MRSVVLYPLWSRCQNSLRDHFSFLSKPISSLNVKSESSLEAVCNFWSALEIMRRAGSDRRKMRVVECHLRTSAGKTIFTHNPVQLALMCCTRLCCVSFWAPNYCNKAWRRKTQKKPSASQRVPDSPACVVVDVGLVVLSGIVCSANVRRQSVLGSSVRPSLPRPLGLQGDSHLLFGKLLPFYSNVSPSRTAVTHIQNLKLQMFFNPLLGQN